MEASTEFKINTLRRRCGYLIKKMSEDDSANAKRFNDMEVEALQSGMLALEKEAEFDDVADCLIEVLRSVEYGTTDELCSAVNRSNNVIDKYKI